MMRAIGLSSVCASALISSTGFAQTVPTGDQPAVAASQPARTTSYDAAFFAGYAPRTALDIARRVPGFALDLGNTDTRGFAGAAGNVVINGARPSSKAESLETTLSRIPASSVVRVEIGPGDLFGAEYSSRSQVLNVILSAAGGFEGNVTASARRSYRGHILPNGTGSVMIKRGASTINLAADSGLTYNYEEGSDTLTNAETGAPKEFRRKFNVYKDTNPSVSASWALERASDQSIRLNARYALGRFDLDQKNRVTPAVGAQHDDSLVQEYKNPVFEVGGDVTRPLGGGAIKLVGLATRRKRDNFDGYYGRAGLLSVSDAVVGGSEQFQKAKTGETIGRLTWNRQDLGGYSVELGGEAVLNTLDSTVDLFRLGPGGTRTRINLSIDSAKVKEKRGEVFLNVGKTISPALRLDGGLTFEYSDLTVSGDASAHRKLQFFKPNFSADWKPGGGWHTRFSIRRTVAQLNFYDFISVAELSNDRVNGGNENLVPQRAWEYRLTADHPILGDGLIKVDAGYDLIDLLQDRVLIVPEVGEPFDAPGNIGTGKRSFIDLTVDAPLGRLWSGLRVKLFGELQRTRVEDPISGETRNFSDFFPNWRWEVDVRRDSGPWSYGFVVNDRDDFTFFRTDEFDNNRNGQPYGTAFVEYRPDARTAITLDVDNAFDTNALRRRTLFDPNRAAPESITDELRERNRHVNFGLTIKRSFGGGGTKSVAAPATN